MPTQVAVGGLTPRPTKASEASVRMALASQREPITRISGRMFGRIWTIRIRVSEEPSARPASTNSRSLTAIVGARAIRANGGIEVNAMAMVMFSVEGPDIATGI